mmetsp:Transcript_559/g.1772  ORF Transcript_559/g.1772 Transcript_559/m.1772 type:complete len:318 (+) Transcript_559:710-1663(+)
MDGRGRRDGRRRCHRAGRAEGFQRRGRRVRLRADGSDRLRLLGGHRGGRGDVFAADERRREVRLRHEGRPRCGQRGDVDGADALAAGGGGAGRERREPRARKTRRRVARARDGDAVEPRRRRRVVHRDVGERRERRDRRDVVQDRPRGGEERRERQGAQPRGLLRRRRDRRARRAGQDGRGRGRGEAMPVEAVARGGATASADADARGSLRRRRRRARRRRAGARVARDRGAGGGIRRGGRLRVLSVRKERLADRVDARADAAAVLRVRAARVRRGRRHHGEVPRYPRDADARADGARRRRTGGTRRDVHPRERGVD